MTRPRLRLVLSTLSAIASAITGAQAQRPIVATIERADGYGRPPEAPVLSRLIAAGKLRRATNAEIARAAANNPAFAADLNDWAPPYFMLKPIDPADLREFSGGYARYFIVPPSVRQRDFGRTHSSFVTTTGACLQGSCGGCAPAAYPGFRSDQIPGSCMAVVPAAPPAPPRR